MRYDIEGMKSELYWGCTDGEKYTSSEVAKMELNGFMNERRQIEEHMKIEDTQEFWENEFGDAYHKRNRVDWRQRVTFWSHILELTGARSVWEWGCGPGWNLTAIQSAASRTKRWFRVGEDRPDEYQVIQWPVQVYGTECNESAIQLARVAGLDVNEWMPNEDDKFELACTVGALIHVPPDDVQDLMRKIVDASSDYVLAVEYDAQKESMVNYRGHDNKLWCRPYGQMYQNMGLQLIAEGDAGDGDGFDECKFSLLRK